MPLAVIKGKRLGVTITEDDSGSSGKRKEKPLEGTEDEGGGQEEELFDPDAKLYISTVC